MDSIDCLDRRRATSGGVGGRLPDAGAAFFSTVLFLAAGCCIEVEETSLPEV